MFLQRKLLKDFLIMKGKGTIAPHIQISDMREWLVKKGTYMPKYM